MSQPNSNGSRGAGATRPNRSGAPQTRQQQQQQQPARQPRRDNSTNSIFYKPQQRLQRQYKQIRTKQAAASGNSPTGPQTRPNASRRSMLKPVRPIALGVGNGRNGWNGRGGRVQNLKVNNFGSKIGQAASAQVVNFLPPGQPRYKLRKRSLGGRRAYVGHFEGTTEPQFKKSTLTSKRACDLKGYVDEIHFHREMKVKVKEYKIQKMKYGSEADKERILNQKRPYWFEFKEGPKATPSGSDANNNNNSSNSGGSDAPVGTAREFLGKPKQDDTNFRYAVLEWDQSGTDGTQAYIYPCDYIDFVLKNQLLARGEASSEIYEKQARRREQMRQKQEREKMTSVFNQLGKLFGHDDGGRSRDGSDVADKDHIVTRDPATGKMVILGPQDAKMSDEKRGLYERLKQNKRDLARGTRISGNVSYLIENRGGLKTTDAGGAGSYDPTTNSGVAGVDLREFDIVHNSKSKRLRATKTRGALEELPDYEENFEDDGDEVGLGDEDVVDDGLSDNDLDNQEMDEFDEMDDEDGVKALNKGSKAVKEEKVRNDDDDDDMDEFDKNDDDSESDEENETFQKLNALMTQSNDLVKKDYEVPLPAKADDNKDDEKGEEEGKDTSKDKDDLLDLESESEGDNWMQLTDDEEEDEDVKGTKKMPKTASSTMKNGDNNGMNTKGKDGSRKRPLSEMDNNGNNSGEPAKKRLKKSRPGSGAKGAKGGKGGDDGIDEGKLKLYTSALRDVVPKSGEGANTQSILSGFKRVVPNVDNKVFVRALSNVANHVGKIAGKTYWVLK